MYHPLTARELAAARIGKLTVQAARYRLAALARRRPGQRTGRDRQIKAGHRLLRAGTLAQPARRDDWLTHACLLDDGQPVMRAALRNIGQASGCRPAPALRR